MSGHSKWAQIKRAKGANDVKRGQIFTKLGREISVSAREGGGADPAGNARLRMAVDRAREANMPMDTIQRAIQRGVGGGEGAALEEVVYEAYGAGGAALLIEATTDNRNRTVAEVRAALTRGGGSLGESGSVAWNFESHGVIYAQPRQGDDPEELALKAIDAGADDFSVDGNDVEILTDPTQVDEVRQALEVAGAVISSAEVAMVPKTQLELPDDQTAAVMRLVERLEDLDDVTRVYTNVHISDEVLAQAAAG
ncbi:MAG TPA: YebC/PmpR family DNA-binding transcriptional regulator [Chloroflexota bacterium]|nr:YebC/PmpR family DNA-binding transcriptional regulator [Chloroflexota bacterium]